MQYFTIMLNVNKINCIDSYKSITILEKKLKKMQQVLSYSYKSIITYQFVTVLIGKLKNGIQYIKLKKL